MEHFFDGRVKLLHAPRFDDERGGLVPLAFPIAGLTPVRSFLVTAPDGSARGGHGHLKARQLLMCAGGEVGVDLVWRGETRSVELNAPEKLLLIEPGVWSQQKYRGNGAALIVFSDRPYEPEDYFETPMEFEETAE